MNETKNLLEQRTRQFRDAAEAGVSTSENSYMGLVAHAKPGLHAHLLDVLQRHVPAPRDVLDIASGSGALALRLKNAGYRVFATDYVEQNFRLHGEIPFSRSDLNGPFSSQFHDRFDALVACEIIEHIENPWNFLRQCSTLLKEGGVAIVTTPNTCSAPSKAMFLRSNEFAWFSGRDYERHGHITPLDIATLERCALGCDFEILDFQSFGNPWDHCVGSPRLRLLALLAAVIDPTKRALRGDILVMTLRAKRRSE